MIHLVFCESNTVQKDGMVKIISKSYTHAHGFRALKRLHKAVIYNQRDDLHKMYKALIHLERYMERLTLQKRSMKQKN